MRRLLLLVLLCHAMTASIVAQPKYAPGVNGEGFVYFLPKTALRISVLVEKTTYTPGEFAAYAQRYLRLNDVSQQASVSYQVIGLQQTAVAVADTAKGYTVHFDVRSVTANAQLSPDGCLLAINAPSAVDSIASPALFHPSPRRGMTNPRELLGEEILAAGSTRKMAELTAQEIYDLRENRTLLIKGQAEFNPKDGRQLEAMLREIDSNDQALTSMFKGVTRKDTTEHIIWYYPTSSTGREVLFRLSQLDGMVDSDDLSGAPYYISIEDLQTVAKPAPLYVKGKKIGVKIPKGGIYVNVPGRMKSTIYRGIEPIDTKEFPAPQFGNVELLGSSLFSKRYTTRLWLNPLTGAIDRLQAELPK